jgi:hypothetical protein
LSVKPATTLGVFLTFHVLFSGSILSGENEMKKSSRSNPDSLSRIGVKTSLVVPGATVDSIITKDPFP